MSGVLVIGRTGQLARALQERLPDATALGRETLDLGWDADRIAATLAPYLDGASRVVNAAAYTAVDRAEDDQDTASAVNADAPTTMARLCAERDLPFVHISTDYVFAGDGSRPYRPDDATAPINAYGRTKREGEVGVLAAGGTVLRTSWVYDATGKNFVTTMLRLAESRDSLSVVGDQIGRPTFAGDLADAVLAVLARPKPGLYHVSNTGDPISWAEFASAIFDIAKKEATVTPIPATDYPTPAARPGYSVLDVSDFEADFGHSLPDWRTSLEAVLTGHTTETPQKKDA